MTRPYQLKRRAEQQAETRLKIVEATIDLHSIVGPAATTISMIADRAGVQRHTVYAHFADEKSLFMACSGLALERDPLPDATPWRAIADPAERLKVGLRAIYGWFERNVDIASNVLRDAEHHQATKEINAIRIDPHFAEYRAVLGGELAKAEQRAALALALNFFAWRTLVRENGLDTDAAIAVMVRAVFCGEPKRPRGA